MRPSRSRARSARALMWSHAPEAKGVMGVRGWRITLPATPAGVPARPSKPADAPVMPRRLGMHRLTYGIGGQMITDEKCRRAVHTLRQLDDAVDNGHMGRTVEHDPTILSMIRDAAFGLDGSIFQRPADLVGRPGNPTCRNLSNDERPFRCGRCGYKAFTYCDSGCDPEDFTYCPECRAEVVEGEY